MFGLKRRVEEALVAQRLILAAGLLNGVGVLTVGSTLAREWGTTHGVHEVMVIATVEPEGSQGEVDAVWRITRADVARYQKDRFVEGLIQKGEFRQAAAIALACVNAMPDRVDRVEYFLRLRIEALGNEGRAGEALQAAKSLFYVCSRRSLEWVIPLVARQLENAPEFGPAAARRFKLQQFAAPSQVDVELGIMGLGNPVLEAVKIREDDFVGEGLEQERNREWRTVGEGNLLLMRGEVEASLAMFGLLDQSRNEGVRKVAAEGVERGMKSRPEVAGSGGGRRQRG